ncbi:hypothetical protein WICMUC_004869 [Wickerhamomyces mucosus]|uniref:methylated diphthine methylhydrolase n=1 Tax=Wickerhamomyces mucosus TaxID=1378264 RepID=A0A9P8PEX7_9ASCO|nr:hypothetical protein WICMUC_004869 [Wickerhamomyces mucosus]
MSNDKVSLGKTIAYAKTKLPPCSIRYHPSIPNLLFIGTYKLDEVNKKRHGSIEIYFHSSENNELTLQQSINTESAILDLKFSPFEDDLIITGQSTGDISIWKYIEEVQQLKLIHNERLFDEENLITSIIFSPVHKNRLLISTTEGFAVALDITSNGNFTNILELNSRHDLQCWTGAFGNFAELNNVIFTGGDDGALIAHDFRTQDQIFNAKRIHNAGVVAIQTATPGDHNGHGDWFVNQPYKLFTGSYDDEIRDLDLRCIPEVGLVNGLPPRSKSNMNLGGGVWRFQPSVKQGDNRLLTCCMYDGARIFNSEEFKVEKYYKEKHESMCYGCDWNPNNVGEVATVSFYDNVLQIWEP